MAVLPVSPTAGAVLLAILMAGYLLYRAALPKPIPGIPHHKASARHVLGDVPSLLKHQQTNPQIFDWISDQGLLLQSPVYQLFITPFANPKVVISDAREILDLEMRRLRDFDRGDLLRDVLDGLGPNHHIHLPTNDQWKAHRRLIADLMSPSFLNVVAARHLHKHSLHLMDLWRVKARLAQGHPIAIGQDVGDMILDTLWTVSLGVEVNNITTQLNELRDTHALDLASNIDHVAVLPKPKLPDVVEAMKVLTQSVETAIKSPLPRQTHWLIRQTPSYRRARSLKDALVQSNLEAAKARLSKPNGTDDLIDCAADLIVLREKQIADKEGRAPHYDNAVIQDELFGFLFAGHDSTGATMRWAVKYIAAHPDMQSTLRSALHAAYPDAHAKGQVPSAEAITKTDVPYLDGVIEEILRLGLTASAQTRKALRDTEVLGHRIPKGTEVFLMSNGPGFIQPDPFAASIPEHLRSKSSQETKQRVQPWDAADIAAFKPERWLKTREDGSTYFDPQAGPTLQFGAGVRGCYGRKLAYLTMRMLITIMVWDFEFGSLPDDLSSFAAKAKLFLEPILCYGRLVSLSGTA